MKFPVAWHEQCLENQRRHYGGLLAQIERLKVEYARGQQQIIAYDAQIIRAKETGASEFDREKFGRKRKAPDAAHSETPTKE